MLHGAAFVSVHAARAPLQPYLAASSSSCLRAPSVEMLMVQTVTLLPPKKKPVLDRNRSNRRERGPGSGNCPTFVHRYPAMAALGGAVRRALGRGGASGRWIPVTAGRRAASAAASPHAASSSAAVLAGVGSALGAGFLWAATMKPALAEEEGKGKKGKGGKVCSIP